MNTYKLRNKQRQLIDAVIKKQPQRIKQLLSKKVDPNGVLDKCLLTPLHFAVIYESQEAAKILLKHGAKKELYDIDGLTPMDWARESMRNDMIAILSN